MKRFWIFMILIACPATMLGQGSGSGWSGSSSHHSATSMPNTRYGGGGWWGGWDSGWGGSEQTAEGAALQGTAQVLSAAGQYNQATSAAAINLTEAQSNAMRNQVQGVQTFYQMRELGGAEREKERGMHPTPEELARRAHAAAPRDLSPSQMDPVSGVLFWPAALQDASFEANRLALDDYTVRWAKYGVLDYADKVQVRRNIDAMFVTLKSQITSMPPQDYVESRVFLESLLYATTRSMI